MPKHPHPTIAWNIPALRRHGRGLREAIALAYVPFARATTLVRRERALDRWLEHTPTKGAA